MTRVVVVGGGIAGLAAAHRLHTLRPGLDVVVLDQRDRPGGKLATGELAGGPVERGAESFLMGDPAGGPSAAVRLAEEVGLGPAIVHPTPARAAVALDGGLRDLPAGTMMGIPLKATDSAADDPAPAPLLSPGGDVTVGGLVRARRGDAVVDHYVEPLLGGVYAGRADHLSLRMALPALAAAAERTHTLTDALAEAVGASRRTPGAPVFGTIQGGMGRLVGAVAATLPGVRSGVTVRALHRHGAGWRLTLGSTRDAETLDADGVVLAVPAAPAARLLAAVEGARAVPLEYASVALVALALPDTALPELSGFLVPATEGYSVKAVTFFDRKWAHLRRPGVTVLRASIGRHGDEARLQHTDDDLVQTVRAEVAKLLGMGALPAEIDRAVFRWGGALPQYEPGHRDRVATLRAGLAEHPAIAVAGAAYDGVGIPACIASGRAAAETVLAGLEQWTP
ncbi:protoporphyrinogen oxidase [Dactylosporangium salmoneum]|uniref:Coproporphyrinogen III oxidase n=1 Tax=Dactylosporangium salmoneum TaxID=53361 RepID=A0ABN3HJC8_9ACTN